MNANTNVIDSSDLITPVINISERLKEAREAAGLKQQELATAAGVSQGTIANIESGLRKNPRELLAIAKALNVQPEWLKNGKSPRGLVVSALPDGAVPVTLKFAFRVGIVQGGNNGFIEDCAPSLQDPEPVYYASTLIDEQAYAVKVRGSSMEPAIMAGWDVIASPNRPAEPPDLCAVYFADGRKSFKRLVWVRAGMVCLESISAQHEKITEPVENITRMDKVISIVPN
ncbi:MAG: LexA family transcriptional regulator [Polaromonas sp.]|nr:LexA family transcriptional regulator [Polaromonas sp.]